MSSAQSTVLVTGSNIGLGLDACRQFAVEKLFDRIILACRTPAKAEAAAKTLRALPGVTATIEVLILDVSDPASCLAAVKALTGTLDGLVLNAGGMSDDAGVCDPKNKGATNIFAVNVSGHVIFLEALMQANKLAKGARVIFAGSEMSRGVNKAVLPFGEKAVFPVATVDAMATYIDGSKFGPGVFMKNKSAGNLFTSYGEVKAIGTLYMSAMARKFPDYFFFTVSPGMTAGTNMLDSGSLPGWIKIMMSPMVPMMSWTGVGHPLATGAKRYVDGACRRTDIFKREGSNGKFFASPKGFKLSGVLTDQAKIDPVYDNVALQDVAYEAIHRFV
jgi:NAD(P)-dependent dehydrogenase (short-subunit alcohol dehydrogenase family)